MVDILEMLPFGNSIDIVQLKGKTIRESFEKSAALWSFNEREILRSFIQVSGKYLCLSTTPNTTNSFYYFQTKATVKYDYPKLPREEN